MKPVLRINCSNLSGKFTGPWEVLWPTRQTTELAGPRCTIRCTACGALRIQVPAQLIKQRGLPDCPKCGASKPRYGEGSFWMPDAWRISYVEIGSSVRLGLRCSDCGVELGKTVAPELFMRGRLRECKACRAAKVLQDDAKRRARIAEEEAAASGAGTPLSKYPRYRSYLYGALARKLEWKLTLPQFEELSASDCRYCGRPAGLRGSGVDRVDNSVGYVLSNCVPCCSQCNQMKWAYGQSDFLAQVGRIARHCADDISRIPP